ncbi:MAG: hypothetical protein AAGI66_07440 [Cyanobacteria bacterium P01_H01_bin.74]
MVAFSKQLSLIALLGLMALEGVILPGCRNDDVIAVNTNDKNTPQYAYRLDEIAMLELLTEEIFSAEKDKHYARIYSAFTAPSFKERVSESTFLSLTTCVEKHLGHLESYNPEEKGFYRKLKFNKATEKTIPYDIIKRNVFRFKETITEELVFEKSGLQFQLADLIWHTNNTALKTCFAKQQGFAESHTDPAPLSGQSTTERESVEADVLIEDSIITPLTEEKLSEEKPSNKKPAASEQGSKQETTEVRTSIQSESEQQKSAQTMPPIPGTNTIGNRPITPLQTKTRKNEATTGQPPQPGQASRDAFGLRPEEPAKTKSGKARLQKKANQQNMTVKAGNKTNQARNETMSSKNTSIIHEATVSDPKEADLAPTLQEQASQDKPEAEPTEKM